MNTKYNAYACIAYLTNVDVGSLASEAAIGPDGDPGVALVPHVDAFVHRVQDINEAVGPHLQLNRRYISTVVILVTVANLNGFLSPSYTIDCDSELPINPSWNRDLGIIRMQRYSLPLDFYLPCAIVVRTAC